MSRLKKAALWLTLLALVVKVSGFLRESIIARQFGVSEYTDGYLLAFSFITLVLAMLSGGFNNVFLPLYIKSKKDHPAIAENNANSILNSTIVFFLGFTLIGMFFVPLIVPIIFGEMTPLTEQVAIEVTRIFFMFMTLIALNALLDSYLQSRRIFIPSQLSKLSGTLMGAVFALLFSDVWGIKSLAYGFLFGIFIGVCLQIYYLAKSDYKWSPTMRMDQNFKHSFFMLLIPSLLNSAVGQINMFINKMFASGTTEGAVTYLNNASLIVSLPHTIYGTTIAVIIFTLLSEQVNDQKNFQQTFFTGMQISLITLLPIAVGLFFIGGHAVSFIYERGAYTTEDSYNTYMALIYYLPMIVTQGLQYIVSKSMYAKGKTRIILRISITTIIMNIVLNILLVKPFGYPGLALSSSFVSIYYLSVSTIFVYKDFEKGEFSRLINMVVRIIPTILMMVISLYGLKELTYLQSLNQLLQIIMIIPVGVLSYIIGLYIFYRHGFSQLLELVRKKGLK